MAIVAFKCEFFIMKINDGIRYFKEFKCDTK